jgi:hypothetical protein
MLAPKESTFGERDMPPHCVLGIICTTCYTDPVQTRTMSPAISAPSAMLFEQLRSPASSSKRKGSLHLKLPATSFYGRAAEKDHHRISVDELVYDRLLHFLLTSRRLSGHDYRDCVHEGEVVDALAFTWCVFPSHFHESSGKFLNPNDLIARTGPPISSLAQTEITERMRLN